MSFEGSPLSEVVIAPSNRSARPKRAKRSVAPYGLAGIATTIVTVAGIMLGALGGSAAASNPDGAPVAAPFDRQVSTSRDTTRTAIDAQLAKHDEQLAKLKREVDTSAAQGQAEARAKLLNNTQQGIVSHEKQLKAELNKLAWPAEGRLGSPWGQRLHPILRYYRMHRGTDIGAACGSPIRAAYDGVVIHAAYDGGAGNNVKVEHSQFRGKSLMTISMHMTHYIVQVGQKVKKGEVIGYVGNTGMSTECHLHFETWVNGENVDPAPLLRS